VTTQLQFIIIITRILHAGCVLCFVCFSEQSSFAYMYMSSSGFTLVMQTQRVCYCNVGKEFLNTVYMNFTFKNWHSKPIS